MAGPLKVVGGVDPHADTIHVAVITLTGKAVADREFATTADGYRSATAFLTATGAVVRVGVEGAASYGAGLTRALKTARIDVVDVDRRPGSTGGGPGSRTGSTPITPPGPCWPDGATRSRSPRSKVSERCTWHADQR